MERNKENAKKCVEFINNNNKEDLYRLRNYIEARIEYLEYYEENFK